MSINFTLYPSFLQAHFSHTRVVLEGKKPVSVVVFSQVDLAAQNETAEIITTEVKPRKPEIKLPSIKVSTRLIQAGLFGVIGLAIVITLVLVTPALYYRVFPAEVRPVESSQTGTPLGGDFTQGTQAEPSATPRPLPPQDSTLPEGTWLIVPRIGIRTQPLLTEDPEEALLEGVWQVPGYGEAGDTTRPMILAAHRYGWQWWWKTDYWKYHSFYLLPDLEPGDIVEIISDQRKYYYEIYAGEEGEDITDYSADLILYTCKFLNSPLRHFRYARLVDMTKDTQAALEG